MPTIKIEVELNEDGTIWLDDLGQSVSLACDYEGSKIMRVMMAAFEDANYHVLYAFLDKHKERLLRSLDPSPVDSSHNIAKGS